MGARRAFRLTIAARGILVFVFAGLLITAMCALCFDARISRSALHVKESCLPWLQEQFRSSLDKIPNEPLRAYAPPSPREIADSGACALAPRSALLIAYYEESVISRTLVVAILSAIALAVLLDPGWRAAGAMRNSG
ncbi:MAG: hypothetical protein HY078_06740 [Elusimicrobia bacterium]|nr:hypothetical protein [Elusimicrobiota bacterium]